MNAALMSNEHYWD